VTSQLEIAVNEACTNIIQHAYKGDPSGEIVLEILNNGTDIIFRLTDFAKPVDPAGIKPRDLSDIRPGGLGTHFMREIMDDCSFEQLADGSGNCLEMVKKIE
jgi:sigma-B regulation protein RsbU (phosphoserine phosphatase)